MEQKRKLILTAVVCAAADLIVIALIVLFFGTYRDRKNAEPSGSAEAGIAQETDAADAVPADAAQESAPADASPAASAEPLTEEQVKRLLEEATEAYVGWVVGWGATLDRDGESFTENNMKYFRVTDGAYKSIEEIKAALHAVYTNACCADRCSVDSLYIERDGKLYGYELLGQGGDAPPGSATLKILSQTETECRVRVTYSSDYANDLNCTLVKEDGRWKFPEPINVYTGYPYLEPSVPWTD